MNAPATIAALLSQHGFRAFALSRNAVGHLRLFAALDGQRIDMILDTGAAGTLIDMAYCQAQGLAMTDTGSAGGGGVEGRTHTLFKLDQARLSLDDLTLQNDGLIAMSLTHVNQKLAGRGADGIQAILGQDVLRRHRAVVDYATLTLYLGEPSES